MKKAVHWADIYAERIVREKGERETYVCASGITPSGTVHIGNFREIISVELVVRALIHLGKNVRFIYSWDDFDVFRKVPANMPNPEELEKYLWFPITKVPDPHGVEESYARSNEKRLETTLSGLGIHPEYIYQADMYSTSRYAQGMKKALDNRDRIRALLNEHRSSPLPDEWLPISVFCSSCQRDTTQVAPWEGDWNISYSCSSCGHSEQVDLREATGAKLPWRVDWPMRWEFERVDFEPAGKEHHSAGGSFDTAKRIVKDVYDREPPVTFKYDFITIKGTGGKMSASKGNVLSIADVLEIYQPELVRYMFAGTRPDTEFAVSFDLDVIKLYEDYDRCERVYFGSDEIGEKKRPKERRIYELSQVEQVPDNMPVQIPFRHLCNLLQIHNGDITAAVDTSAQSAGNDLTPENRNRLRVRAGCAWNWITEYAPEDFKFALKSPDEEPLETTEAEGRAIRSLAEALDTRYHELTEETLGQLFYSMAEEYQLQPKDLYRLLYRVLIGKERGPRLAGFILIAGKERILPILDRYR